MDSFLVNDQRAVFTTNTILAVSVCFENRHKPSELLTRRQSTRVHPCSICLKTWRTHSTRWYAAIVAVRFCTYELPLIDPRRAIRSRICTRQVRFPNHLALRDTDCKWLQAFTRFLVHPSPQSLCPLAAMTFRLICGILI